MARSGQPNIVLILADEQHVESLGWRGTQPVRTPHIDRLAAEGRCFTQAFCCASICSPSRAALFTGQLPHRFGEVTNDLTIPPGTPNLAGSLRHAGYRLGYAGKWHVDDATVPTSHGFEGKDFPGYGFPCWMLRTKIEPAAMQRKRNWYYEYLVENGFDVPTLTESGACWEAHRQDTIVFHGRQSGSVEASIPGFVGTESVRLAESLCRRRRQDGLPFFLWTNFWGPHNPCYIPEPYYSMVDPASIPEPASAGDSLAGKPHVQTRLSHYWGMHGAPWSAWQEHVARYFGYCTLIDAQVGRIRRTLEEAGELDNTLFVYASDHGDMMGRHQLLDKGPFMYDDTYRVPLIMRGPGIEPGACGQFVYLHDLFPTILHAASVAETPAGDAADLTPLLTGTGVWTERDAVFGEFDNQIVRFPQRMIRTHTHKFIYNTSDICELYDLERDPDEMRNLVADAAYGAIKDGLKRRLLDHLHRTGDRVALRMEAMLPTL